MSTLDAVIQLPPAPTYGAVELKKFISKATLRGFLITVGLLLFLLLIYFIYQKATEKPLGGLPIAPISKISLESAPQQMDNAEETPPPQINDAIIDYSTAARAGTPVPVPDAEIKADLKDFANLEDLNKSLSSNEGQQIDLNQLPQNFDLGDKKLDVQNREEAPDINEFIPVEKEPQIDLVELQKRIVYPEVARKAGIEGQVIVRVLVNKDGKPKQAVIQHSDSQMLDQSAKDAVMKSVFTPAIQNGQPIICWVSIPIKFRLR
jgi:TonB family protein